MSVLDRIKDTFIGYVQQRRQTLATLEVTDTKIRSKDGSLFVEYKLSATASVTYRYLQPDNRDHEHVVHAMARVRAMDALRWEMYGDVLKHLKPLQLAISNEDLERAEWIVRQMLAEIEEEKA